MVGVGKRRSLFRWTPHRRKLTGTRGVMTEIDDNESSEARRENGERAGRSWAATAPLEEKVQLGEMLPDPNVEHDSRCAQIARWLKQQLLDPQNQARWPTLFPLLKGRGLTETMSDTDTWLAGFVDGALDMIGS
jgi:hypothetical protein